MSFLAGAIAGGVVGLVAGALLQRRAGSSSVVHSRGFATTLALVALVVAAVALAASADDGDRASAPIPVASATVPTSTAPPASTTTSEPRVPTGLVTVPNVSHPPRTRNDAVAILKRAGLEVNIETLVLSNVPPGYVISQSPLPEAMTAAGSRVLLVVSAAA
jgi:ABC-type uncharacterized transport system permease subunit